MAKKCILFIFLSFFLQKSLPAQKNIYQVVVIGFYNLENFYDTIDNPIVDDNDFLPSGAKNYTGEIYWNKVNHLARVIAQMGTTFSKDGPALLGTAEIENDTVLNDLIHDPQIAGRHYQYVHYDSWDHRGIDVALIYNPQYFKVEESRKLFVKIPIGVKSSYYTRDVLMVKGILCGETIYVLVNHWPSRLGGEVRSAPARAAAALVNRNIIDSIQRNYPGSKIILMGDLNDDPISPSLVKVLGAKGKSKDLKPGDLFNPWMELYKKGIGTLAYQDSWGLFDQILINTPWMDHEQAGFFYSKQYVFNQQFMIENRGRYTGYPMRTWDGNNYRGGFSDHFPTYLVLLRKKQ
ncbi:MAG: endonuclease/exonuclease/phosphatase [Bacteroidetes bacterium]|nr:endonuclease/exonuclease/phosphatase [Bacteroidota bacterium]